MIDIKDTFGNIRFSTPVNEGSLRRFLLMQEDYITLNFSLAAPTYFKLGDYVEDERFGLFEITDIYKPTYNETTGGYDYELRFDAHYWKWKNKVFKYMPEVGGQEASWNLTATLDVQLEVFKRNLKSLGYNYKGIEYSVSIDNTVENSAKLMMYDNTNMLDALTNLAQTWDCEWWVTNSIIHFGKCEFSDPVDFKLGDNVKSMTRSESQSKYATRIYAFGSTRNIPPTYRKKLVFDVTNVSGNRIWDSSRKLKPEYFPQRSYIYENSIVLKLNKEEQTYYTSKPAKYSTSWKIAENLKSGNYNIAPDSFYIRATKGGAGHSLISLSATLSLQYEVNGETKTVFVQSVNTSGQSMLIARFADSVFILNENASKCRLLIEADVNYSGSDVDILFNTYCNAVLQNRNSAVNIPVTFVSGVNEGKTFNSVYNPDFLKESNTIQLPEGVSAALGDKYIIDNIIKEKVPVSYFTSDIEDVVVNGIVQKRLMLPIDTPYLDAYEGMIQEEAVEGIVVFDEIYPKRIGTLEDVTSYTDSSQDDSETTEKAIFYRFKDSGLNFSEDYIIPNETLKITFQSGKMNGMTFEVVFNPENEPELNKDDSWNTKAQLWEIKRNEDYGRFLPDNIIKPENGDKYILSGFNTLFVSDAMIPDAEKELKKEAEKYIAKSKIDPSTYSCTMMSDVMQSGGKENLFEIGDRVNLINAAFFDNGNRVSRIIGFEYSLDIPFDAPVYTVGETASYSKIGDLESKIDSLTYKGQTYIGQGTVGGSGVYLIRLNDNTPPSDSNAFSAKRSLSEFVSKKYDDKVAGNITFEKDITVKGLAKTLNLEVEQLATIARCVVDIISSPVFVDGFFGEGFQIWKSLATGDWNMTIDRLTVRKVFTVFELLIQKMRSVGGMLVVSAADGKIETVERVGDDYRITFASGNGFQANDLIRHQIFSGDNVEHYWTKVKSVDGNNVIIPVSEFEGVEPQVGDECVLMGNTKNKLRQSLITISAIEDGQPRIDILSGVDSKSFEGKLVTRLGNMDGIKDIYFPADNQPHGDGLYGTNCYLRGTFLLVTGEDVLTKFLVMENMFRSEMENLRNEIQEKDNYLSNSAFASDTDRWETTNDIRFFTVGGKFLFFNGNFYSNKKQVADIIKLSTRNVLRIKASGIKQTNADLARKPKYNASDTQGNETAPEFFVSFRVRVLDHGVLTIGFPGQGLYHTETLEPTDEFIQKEYSGTWDGTGDFEMKFTGDAYFYSLALTDNAFEEMYTKFSTKIEQTNERIELLATATSEMGDKLQSSINVTAKDISLVSEKTNKLDNTLTSMGIVIDGDNGNIRQFVKKDGVISSINQTSESVSIDASKINLNGVVTANERFKIFEDGSMEAINGRFFGLFSTQNTKGNRIIIDPERQMLIMRKGESTDLLTLSFSASSDVVMGSGVLTIKDLQSFSTCIIDGKSFNLVQKMFTDEPSIEIDHLGIIHKRKKVKTFELNEEGLTFYDSSGNVSKRYPSS